MSARTVMFSVPTDTLPKYVKSNIFAQLLMLGVEVVVVALVVVVVFVVVAVVVVGFVSLPLNLYAFAVILPLDVSSASSLK